MRYARWKRLLGFDAGPENHTFYVCDDCYPSLKRPDVMCFHVLKGYDVKPIEAPGQEEIQCDLCREP